MNRLQIGYADCLRLRPIDICIYRGLLRLVPKDNVDSVYKNCIERKLNTGNFKGNMEACDLGINIIGSFHRCKFFIRFFYIQKGHSYGAALSPYEN